MIQIFNPLLISQHQMNKKKGKKLNSDLVKALPIKKQKNPTEKDNQNEVLETNFVPLSGKPEITTEINIFNLRKRQHSTKQNVNG